VLVLVLVLVLVVVVLVVRTLAVPPPARRLQLSPDLGPAPSGLAMTCWSAGRPRPRCPARARPASDRDPRRRT
jgi:hypothetical protein